MNTSKHTPAPWHIGMYPGPIIYGPKGEQIADMRGETMVPEDEETANRKLILAAPELLKALQEIMRVWNPETGARLERLVGTTVVNNAAAAIEKATGGL